MSYIRQAAPVTIATASSAPGAGLPPSSRGTPPSVGFAKLTQSQVWNSPSRHDGLELKEEQRMRRAGCAHIMETIRLVLEWPYRKVAIIEKRVDDIDKSRRKPCSTACILFNRFYSRQSFVRHDRFVSLRQHPPVTFAHFTANPPPRPLTPTNSS